MWGKDRRRGSFKFAVTVKKKYVPAVGTCLGLLVLLFLRTICTGMYRGSESERIVTNSEAESQISCDRSNVHYDFCTIDGPTVLDPIQATFFVKGPPKGPTEVERIRAYPRKSEKVTMGLIQEVLLIKSPISPTCRVQNEAPALLFSVADFVQDVFHDFLDAFIPLFITVNSIFPDQDFILVISRSPDWWMEKYQDLLESFTRHPIIRLENNSSTHCFPWATIGLMSHGFMTIDPKKMPNSVTFIHFRAFLERTYGKTLDQKSFNPKGRPRLVMAGRSGPVGRVILNWAKAKSVAEVMGFEVIEFLPTRNTPLREAYELLSSCHAMIGVHGAALTHSLFLRPGSVFMQIVPIGIENLAETCFGKSAKDLGLEYMEYPIGVNESSLTNKYGKYSVILKGPMAVRKSSGLFTGKPLEIESIRTDFNEFKEYLKIMDIYLREQDVILDLAKFRDFMKSAYGKAKTFMDQEG